jgi:hypothetical protein
MGKIVQLSFPVLDEVREKFKRTAALRGLTAGEAGPEAIELWLKHNEPPKEEAVG